MRRWHGLWVGIALGGLVGAVTAQRDAAACRVVDVQVTPSANLQIVVWIEDAAGNFVDTLFITQTTGSYGLGNRPGIMEFNSEYLWPYGRRATVFPVWSHRRGVTYPKVIFQDHQDRDLSHAFDVSSLEPHFCRPLETSEPALARSLDAGSCATSAFTDKGIFEKGSSTADAGFSYYPPRRDIIAQKGVDSADVAKYSGMNDLDAVSQATPPEGAVYTIRYSVPSTLAPGDYVIYAEASKEFDQNSSYDYPSPALAAYGEYGAAYRGQPSVVWQVPISIDLVDHTAIAIDYAGYGDPDGVDGNLRPPDDTISSTVEGSGAQRLLVSMADEGMYRVRVATRPSDDGLPPDPPSAMRVATSDPNSATVSFIEPAGAGSSVTAYQVRYSIGQPLTADNFNTLGQLVAVNVTPDAPGNLQTIAIPNLLPQTHYWVGIAALNTCLASSPPAIIDLTTPMLTGGEVSWCFVATAAYGSPMMPEVSLLRSFRDQVLRRQVVGELLVESYYTFGPALAAVIRPSDTLRAVARDALGPVVSRVHSVMPSVKTVP